MKKSLFFRLSVVFLLVLVLIQPCSALVEETPELDAIAALLVDADSDTILYEKNIHDKLYPASLTKMMTALLTLEAVDRGELSLDQTITVSGDIYNDVSYDAASVGLQEGEELTLNDLLYCMLLPSACEACNVLAEAVSGNVSDFVNVMNRRASELGMSDTHFANAHGLHDPDHYSTAWDLYLLARQVMNNDTFREIVLTKTYTVPATNLSEERVLYTTNALLTNHTYDGYVYSPAIGIKTGNTSSAGYCLAAAAEKNGRTQYTIVLCDILTTAEDGTKVPKSFPDTIGLMEWGFDNFSVTTLLENTEPVAQIHVSLSDADYVLLGPEYNVTALLPDGFDTETFAQSYELYTDEVEAPVSKGDVFGQLTVSGPDEETGETVVYGTVNLVALNDVERNEFRYIIHQIGNLFSSLWFQIVLIAAVIIAIVIILLVVVRRRQNAGRNRNRR